MPLARLSLTSIKCNILPGARVNTLLKAVKAADVEVSTVFLPAVTRWHWIARTPFREAYSSTLVFFLREIAHMCLSILPQL